MWSAPARPKPEPSSASPAAIRMSMSSARSTPCTRPRRGWKLQRRNNNHHLSLRYGARNATSPISAYVFLLLFCPTGFAAAQQVKPAPSPATLLSLVSPEVHSDGSVTFRFRAPNAKDVELDIEGAEPQALQKDDQGVWSLTTTSLAPDYYGYSFVADGVRRYPRRLRERFSIAGCASQPATSSAMGCLWHRGSFDHDQPQPARMVEDQRRESNRNRNAGNAHLDAVAAESGGVFAAAVPVN